MSMKLWPGYCANQLERMSKRVDEENGISVGMVKGGPRIFWWFPSNEFWKNIGCLILDSTSFLWGLRL